MQRFMDFIGYALCHQLSSRTFTAGEWVYPVCARDTGIYLAILVTFVVLACAYRQHIAYRRPPVPVLIVCAAFVLTLVVDGVTSYAGLRGTTNLLRYVSGYLCGIGLGVGLYWVFSNSFYATWTEERLLGKPARTCICGAVLGVAGVVLYLLRSSLGIVGPLLTTTAIIVTFAILAATIASCVRPLMRRIPEGRRLGPFTLVGIGGAAVLLVCLGIIKSLIVG